MPSSHRSFAEMRMPPFLLKFLVIFLILLTGLHSSYSLQTQNYEVTVNTVTVWVRVSDKQGNPIRGLTVEDFEVFEDKLNVPITCFEEEGQNSIPDVSAEKQELNIKKRLVIYLDLFSITGQEYKDLRPAVNRFLDTVPEAQWEISMAAFIPDGKLRILVRPTPDFRKVRSLLDRLPLQSRRDLDIVKKNNEIISIFRKLETGINEEMIIKQACRTANRFAIEEREVSLYSLKALETLMDSVSSTSPDDQKVIAHFSAGFNSDPGRVYYELIEKITGSDSSQLSFENPECQREQSFQPANNVQKAMGGMNRSNVTLYSVNTRALYPGLVIPGQSNTISISESSILTDYRFFQQEMAEESGGLFFPNIKKFDQNINQVMKDLEHQYILCYRQPERKEKTEYRKISINCKKKGVEIRHRKGYIP